MSKRELDLGRLLAKTGRRIEDEGQKTSQRLHDWKKIEQIARDSTRGGGSGGAASFRLADRPQDQLAAKMSAEWLAVRVQLEHLARRAEWLMDQAKAADKSLVRDWTPAQAEAEGWCGSHWRIGETVPVSLRPSGEPYYRGRCLFCGRWPDGDPPAEVLRDRRDGKTVMVAAS
jgi:hypothetical protein